jgi:hypothetical protein
MLWCWSIMPTKVGGVKRRWDEHGGAPAVVRRLARWACVEEVAIDIRDSARLK